MRRLQPKTSLTWERKHSPESKKCRVPYRINPRRNTPKHILIKLIQIKHKGKILKATRATPSCESTRITTGCWTIIDRKTLDFTKEDTPRPRTEEKPQ